MLPIRSIFGLALMLVLGAGGAFAQEAAPLAEEDALSAQQDMPLAQQDMPLAADFGTPLQEDQLDSLRGGFDLVKNDLQLTGTVTGNSAVNVLSGNNAIADGAFTNASGLPMVIQNSGSNVLIQNATVVNVQLK